ncbi:tRNA preQ1(34) S-adenosylmethionine ribosyltransferase-isomerase QueA [Campylobacter sp. MG1]|uniref:tRNA preQ1(34) S-adenosylmethionine ribosyltransferase-isomerase QueA n=1 Tax=Campylobacter sp. MG1 TaxID=2976332 RepID=UPI00226CA38B|nr:tRNA preQ1(34) S-adenosylmethionine ribosyltransferase-isomerase QueA [Campylobacter sp. MG1]
MNDISLNSYDYELDDELIAKFPADPADSAKLLVYYKNTQEIKHHYFYELPSILPECAIIFNDTKVFKARIYGQKTTGAKIELFINKILANNQFLVQIRGKVKELDELIFSDIKAIIRNVFNDGTRLVEFYKNNTILSTNEILNFTQKYGHTPLPPYIKRSDNKKDEENYQSIFAKNIGAVAAPTASLHFTKNLMSKLKNFKQAYITLHVGAGTFANVEHENILEHKMHSEYYNLSNEAINLINSDIPLLGVGTTVTRTIEYYARTKQKNGECDLFLHPLNKPIRQNYLLTNFHLPKSTLIMLVASFIGRDETMRIYKEAIDKKYKFYSYGDAMLII